MNSLPEITDLYRMHLRGFPTRANNQLVILLYHGVTDFVSYGIENCSRKHLAVTDFLSQMRFVKKKCNVLSIDDVVDLVINNEKFPPMSVVVSFDDGFENNYSIAAPILSDLKIPAVFYITSGIVSTQLMFWVDSIEDCINLTQENKLRLILDTECEFGLTSSEQKIQALHAIKGFCKKQPASEKDRVINRLVEGAKVEPSVEHSPNYAKITWKQLKDLASNSLFTIGGHSLYHDILSELDPAKMRADIELSLRLLEYNLNEKIVHYSYPEGQENHFNDEVISVLKDNSIVCCPSARIGLNDASVDLFHLYRIMIGFMGTPFPYDDKSLR